MTKPKFNPQEFELKVIDWIFRNLRQKIDLERACSRCLQDLDLAYDDPEVEIVESLIQKYLETYGP
ncbi:MAG: hypothetical protein JST16_10985 [Bdellovibrionales bacterium]|nr:hypothetical protein [Bdellovibrionales bacterium]